MEKLLHTSNLFYNVPAIEAAKLFNQASGMEQVFFTNSGTEAIEGAVKFADFNDLDSVKRLITKNTCAIFMETVQVESGIYPTTEYFIKGVRKLCDENKILMVLDEIQCGMGRSGNMFAY